MAGLRARSEPAARWLWDGFLVAGGLTVLTIQWKTGKTALVSVLFHKMAAGGTLAGHVVGAGTATVQSEEGPEHWAARDRRLPLGPHVRLLCRPFRGRPSLDEWDGLVDSLLDQQLAGRLDLAVIDTLAWFLPGRSKNDAATRLDFLHPLQRLTAAGASVLALHHPRKVGGAPGPTARGSGALLGAADILIDMDQVPPAAADDRRRRLQCFSRYSATPRQQLIELTADETDYTCPDDLARSEIEPGWPTLHAVLKAAPRKLTRQEILSRWPTDHTAPCDSTLWRWLESAVAAGRLCRAGQGRKSRPRVYSLAEMEAVPGFDSAPVGVTRIVPPPSDGARICNPSSAGVRSWGVRRVGGGSRGARLRRPPPHTRTRRCCPIFKRGSPGPVEAASVIRIQLPTPEADCLGALFRSTGDGTLRDRLRVLLMPHRGRARQDIAADLGVHRKTVSRWPNAYLADGLDGLRPMKAPGRPARFPRRWPTRYADRRSTGGRRGAPTGPTGRTRSWPTTWARPGASAPPGVSSSGPARGAASARTGRRAAICGATRRSKPGLRRTWPAWETGGGR